MKKLLFFGVIFTILIIGAIQQTTTVAPNTAQKFNNALHRSLAENQVSEVEKIMDQKLKSQIFIWTSIGLAIVCYFSVMAIIDMSNPKSSILYAKYDTTRGGNEI